MSRKIIQLTFSILLLAGMAFGFAIKDGALAQNNPAPKLEAGLLEQLNQGSADFLVVMAKQADVSAADQLQTKVEKGQYVFDTLVATATSTQADIRAYLDSKGVDYQSFYIVNAIWVKQGTSDLAQTISLRSDVATVSINHQYKLDEPINRQPSSVQPLTVEPNLSFINADDVWAMGINGDGTVMAGNDTGLDVTHPAIAPHYRGCLNPPSCSNMDHNYNWYDAWAPQNVVPWDDYGHGTHTTGTMVGDDGAGNQIGVAPGATTIHCKNMVGGSGDDAHFILCFEWDLAPWDLSGANPLPAMAPDAINNSWGFGGGGNNSMRTSIDNLQAAGVLVEVSAGNEGSGCQSLRSPGDYQEVLTTGSVDHSGQVFPGVVTGFSSRGPSSLDGNYFPDIMAPGNSIRSSLPGNTYEYWSGTSMAGPHATALVGLMWSANPALRGQVAQTIDIIHETAAPLTGQGGSNCGGDYSVGPNNDWGYGTIDAAAAVQLAIAMGGSGQLDGTVTDAVTGDPIADASVVAVHEDGFVWDDLTDATGFYTMTVAAGTFEVTASSLQYESVSVSNVVVVTDTLTVQDFELIPRGKLIGVVTDFDNGFPLVGATIAVSDGSTTTLDDGSYEILLDQGTYTVTASMQDYAPETVDVDIVSGLNTEQNFALQAAIVFTPSPLHVTLDMGDVYNTDASLLNRLSTDYAFEFQEKDGGFVPAFKQGSPAIAPLPVIDNPGTTSVLDQSVVGGTTEFAPANPNAWVPATPYPQGIVRYAKIQCAGDNNSFYVIAGVSNGALVYDMRRYDADTDNWNNLAPISSLVQENPTGVCYEGKFYVTSGGGGVTNFNIYDVESNTWSLGAPLPRSVEGGTMASWDGKIFLIGGDDDFTPGTGVSDQVNIYDIASDTWIGTGAPMPVGISNGGNIQLGQFVYVVGGWWPSSPGSNSNLTLRYDLQTDVWETGPEFIPARSDIPLAATSQYLYVMGGDQNGGGFWDSSNVVWRYDFNAWPSGAWEDVGDPLPLAIQAMNGGYTTDSVAGGEIWSVGGMEGPTFTWHDFNIYRVAEPPWSGTPPDVLWLGEVPVSGTVPAGDTLPVSIYFTATQEVGVNQPGDYLATLKVNGDPKVNVPVIMTVLPPSTWGKLAGIITDQCTNAPIEEALIEITGGDPITQTVSDENGYYVAWIEQGTYSVTFSAPGYVGSSSEYVVLPGQTTNGDVILVPDRPCINVDPDMIEVWVLTDTQVYTSGGLQISNPGTQPLTWEISEKDEGYSPSGSGLVKVDIKGIPVSAPADTAVAVGTFQSRPEGTVTIQRHNGVNEANVLLLNADDDNNGSSPIQQMLLAYGDLGAVDLFDARYAVPTVEQLQVYNVVVVWANYVFSDATAMGNVLADYVDSGGKVIDLNFALDPNWGYQGRFRTEGYSAMTIAGTSYLNSCLGVFDDGHPIMEGISAGNVCDLYRGYSSALTPGSTEVARWQDNELFVAVKDNSSVATINAYVGFYYQWTGQMADVLHNAINWLAVPADVLWLWEEPITGTVSAGSVENVEVSFTSQYTDGTPMPLGTYTATLTIQNNDPVAKSQKLPVVMHIVEEYSAPVPDFGATEVIVGNPTVFTNLTADEGIPPADEYIWDFGDGITMTVGTKDPVSHVYATFGTFTASLTACNVVDCLTVTHSVVVLPKVILLPLVNKN